MIAFRVLHTSCNLDLPTRPSRRTALGTRPWGGEKGGGLRCVPDRHNGIASDATLLRRRTRITRRHQIGDLQMPLDPPGRNSARRDEACALRWRQGRWSEAQSGKKPMSLPSRLRRRLQVTGLHQTVNSSAKRRIVSIMPSRTYLTERSVVLTLCLSNGNR